MKQGNNPKNRTFVRNFNNNGRLKPSVNRNTVLESSGPVGKIRGNAFQLSEKYMVAGKDALLQNDRVLAEICYQYADYYHRLHMNAVRFEEGNKQNIQISSVEHDNQEEKASSEEIKPSETEEKPLAEEKKVESGEMISSCDNVQPEKKSFENGSKTRQNSNKNTLRLSLSSSSTEQAEKKENKENKENKETTAENFEKEEVLLPKRRGRGRPKKTAA
jgi:hypothetical protein